MSPDEFRSSLASAEPPPAWSAALQALWWDGKDDWQKAHALVQSDESDPTNAWVHGYLHRKEGDVSNAGYWYRLAGRPAAEGPLAAEWAAIVATLAANA